MFDYRGSDCDDQFDKIQDNRRRTRAFVRRSFLHEMWRAPDDHHSNQR